MVLFGRQAGRQSAHSFIQSTCPPAPRQNSFMSRSPVEITPSSGNYVTDKDGQWSLAHELTRGQGITAGESRRWDELSQTTRLNAELWVWTASDWLLHCLYTQSVTTINLLIKSLYAITYSWTEDVRVARNVLHNISLSPTIPTIQFHTIFEFSNGITHLSGLF